MKTIKDFIIKHDLLDTEFMVPFLGMLLIPFIVS